MRNPDSHLNGSPTEGFVAIRAGRDRLPSEDEGFGARPAVLVAMPEELTPFLGLGSFPKRGKQVGGAQIWVGDLLGNETLLVQTGLGLANAASAATVACVQLRATSLISAGSAGGMGDDVHVGDVVIASSALYATADATAFGHYVPGQIPLMPPTFTVSSHFRRLAGSYRVSGSDPVNAHQGLIVSGDVFVVDHNFHAYRELFPTALAADMESAAVAQVAHLFAIPWLSVRGISDLCGAGARTEHETHLDGASNLSAAVVTSLLESKPDK